MKSKAAFNEAFLFFGLTLGLTYLVFWGPLALFQIQPSALSTKAADLLGLLPCFCSVGLCLPWSPCF